MPGFLVNYSGVVTCTHGGQAKPTAPVPGIKVMGQQIPMISAPYTVAGCPFPPPPAANGPCVIVNWIPATGTVRVKARGQPLLVQSSTGTCAPPGTPPIIAFPGQTRVKAQ